ncbi:MAG: NAD(P)-dependent oxidoreductase [Candidatus Edwardsbacteria bacterium]
MPSGKKALVTGCNRFIGSHLVEALVRRGYEVHCFVRRTSNLHWLEPVARDFCYGELREKDSLKSAVKDIDYVFHLAAVTKACFPETFYQVNWWGTKNLLEACREANPKLKKFVYLSSQASAGPSLNGRPVKEEDCPHPVSHYGKSKLKAETEVLKFTLDFPVLILRPPGVYGPRDDDFYIYFKLVKRGVSPILGGGENLVNLIFVKDLIEGIILAAEKDLLSGEIFFLADERVYTWREITQTIVSTMGKKVCEIKIPKSLAVIAGSMGDRFSHLTKKPFIINRDKIKEMLQPAWICDISKAKNKLGFQAKYSLTEGIKTTAKWYKENKWL